MSLADALMKYGRPWWAAIGDENASRVAGGTQLLADKLFGPAGTDAQSSFERGRREYKRQLRNVRYESPFRAFLAELAGDATLVGAGSYGAGKAFNVVEFLEKLKQPQPPLRRTREQWNRDLAYGREQFERLRARGPLKRTGHPEATVSGKSWQKIRQSNNRANYDMLPDVPDIYATGEYYGPALNKKVRGDDFQRFHWYQKGNRGIQVGESKYKRTLYNVNPDVEQYLLKHPEIRDLLERIGKK